MALYDTMQVYQAKDDGQEALGYGQLAADFLEKAAPQPMPADSAFLLGRLYFHLGPSMPSATRTIAWPPAGSTRPCPCWRRRR